MTAPGYLVPAGGRAEVQTAQRALGFRLVPGQVCVKKIADAGHRHLGGGLGTHGCPFQLHLDHARLWRTAAGELFATAEPYAMQLADLDWLLTATQGLGLKVMLDGRSVYNPGYTFTILITRLGSPVTLADLALPTRLT